MLKDNQFLKIRVKLGWIYFEIFEQPNSKWLRPRRFHVYAPISNLVNRHTLESKIAFIQEKINTVVIGHKSEFYPRVRFCWHCSRKLRGNSFGLHTENGHQYTVHKACLSDAAKVI